MNYALQTNAAGDIIATYSGGAPLGAPWVPISAAQHAEIVPGSTWSGSAVLPPPAPSAPTLAQQAGAALGAGLAITSTATPALNGTYACDDAAQGRMNRVQGFIAANGKFPGGVSALPWPDMVGAIHTFPTTTEFTAFASAVADYVFALDQVAMGTSTSLPTAAATIA